MKKNVIVSLADANYFSLLEELVDSIKRFKESCEYWNLEFIDNIESIANKLLIKNNFSRLD